MKPTELKLSFPKSFSGEREDLDWLLSDVHQLDNNFQKMQQILGQVMGKTPEKGKDDQKCQWNFKKERKESRHHGH